MSPIRENLPALSSPVRWFLGILGILVLFLIIAQLFVSIFVESLLGNHLKKIVRSSTNNDYLIAFDDLDLGLLNGDVQLVNIRLEPDSAIYNSSDDSFKKIPVLLKADISVLEVKGISLWAYLFRNRLSIGSVLIDQPVIDIEDIPDLQSKSGQKFSSVDSSLYAVISQKFSGFSLDEFSIRNASLKASNNDGSQGLPSIREFNLQLNDILVDSVSVQSGRWFITNDIQLHASDFSMSLSQGFYTVELSQFNLSSSERKMRADSIRLIPRLPRYDFSAEKGFETDRIDLLIPAFTLNDIDFTRAVESGRFYSGSLHLFNTNLEVFHDKNKPFPPDRFPELPQQSFRDFPLPVKIDTIRVHNADITYTEHDKDVPDPGTVTFDKVQVTMESLSNYQEELEDGHKVTMEAETEIMGKGLFNAYFTFYLADSMGAHSIYGNLGSMKFPAFNPVLENLAFVHVNEGIINSMEFSMKLNKEEANGSVTLNYENLHIELLQSETLEQGAGQHIKSFIANTFVVEENNSEPPLRKGEIKFERGRQKSVFNFWWKSLATGLKNSIGL